MLDMSDGAGRLIVDGDKGDSVKAHGFVKSSQNQTLDNDTTYDVYTAHEGHHMAALWIDHDVSVMV